MNFLIEEQITNMKSKDDYFVYNFEYDCWMHRTPLKCFINPILRFIQFWTNEPFVIYSNCEKICGEKENAKWHFEGYGFGRVKYLKVKRINK